MRTRDALRAVALLGTAGLLLVVGAPDVHGDRVVNANEPVVIFDDIQKRVTTVESRSFPPKTSVPATLPAPIGGDDGGTGPAGPAPTFGDNAPAGPGDTSPSSTSPTWPRDPRRPLNAWEPSATPAPSSATAAADDPGASSTTDPGSSTPQVLRFTRPAGTTGEVTVTTGDGSVGSAEIESGDPTANSPEVSTQP
jgi:hypothetical protein